MDVTSALLSWTVTTFTWRVRGGKMICATGLLSVDISFERTMLNRYSPRIAEVLHLFQGDGLDLLVLEKVGDRLLGDCYGIDASISIDPSRKTDF